MEAIASVGDGKVSGVEAEVAENGHSGDFEHAIFFYIRVGKACKFKC